MVQARKPQKKNGKGSNSLQNLSSLASSLASSVASSSSAPSASEVTSALTSTYQAVQPRIKRALEGYQPQIQRARDAFQLHCENALEGFDQALHEDDYTRRQREQVTKLQQPLFENASHYSPLPALSSIRLLTIQPGNPASIISCSLRVVDLENAPKFKALSYSWGKDASWTQNTSDFFSSFSIKESNTRPSNDAIGSEEQPQDLATRVVLCNGRVMNIHQNLYDALVQLRKSSPGDYWIDAICINQSNQAERAQQVSIMGLIYSCAEVVSVWLGVCPDVLSMAMAKLEIHQGFKAPNRAPKNFQQLLGSQIPQITTAVPYLLSRRYFGRLWVLQEVCLAQSIEILIGAHRLSPETLIRISEATQDPEDDTSQGFIPTLHFYLQHFRPYLASAPAVPLLFRTRERLQHGETITLQQWLELVKGRVASDPRDFVNAGLSLVKAVDLHINQSIHARDQYEDFRLWPKLDVNYSLDTTEVLLNLTACLLSKPCGVELLSYSSRVRDALGGDADYSTVIGRKSPIQSSLRIVGVKVSSIASNSIRVVLRQSPNGLDDADPNDLSAVPSWIPNLGSYSSRILDTFTSQGITTFAACTALDGQPTISYDMRTLHVDAVKLAAIQTACCDPLKRSGHKALIDFAASVPTEYAPTGESGLEAVAETCLAGTWGAEAGTTSALRGMLRFFNRGNPDIETASASDNKASGAAYTALEAAHRGLPWAELRKLASKKLGQRFLRDGRRLTLRRSIFTTQDGYIGLGPSWLAQGDHVMLVKGAHVLYVFRHVDEILVATARIIREELADQEFRPNDERREFLEHALRRTEEEFGCTDAWVLIGEAYIRGLMEGQAITYAMEFQRIGIV